MKKNFCIILNVDGEIVRRLGRTEYYVRFRGWRHGVLSDKNEISFRGLNIEFPYSRWSDNELIELGSTLRGVAADMIKAEENR